MSYELKDFVRRVIEVKGGIAEPKEKSEGILDVLLPLELQKKLSLKEYETLSFSPGLPGKLITYGSPLLDNIISLTQDIGLTSAIFIKGVSLKRKGITRLIDEKFEFINVKKRGYLFSEEVTCSYLLVNFRVTIISDERKEELIPVMVDEQTLRAPPTLTPFLSLPFIYQKEEPATVFTRYPLNEVLEKARKKAVAKLKEDLEELEESHLRRLRRDIERLWDYYQGLKKELNHRMRRRSSSPEERENILSKIELIDVEFQRKMEDLKDKYSFKINLEWFNTCRIYLPKIATECEVQRKSLLRNIVFFWNPLLRDTEPVEPLVCEACGEDTYGIFLCDKLHLVCSCCHIFCPECGKKICKKCFPQRCPTCNREVTV